MTCDVCGASLRSDKWGVCTRNSECLREYRRRQGQVRDKGYWTPSTQRLYEICQVNTVHGEHGVCRINPDCAKEYERRVRSVPANMEKVRARYARRSQENREATAEARRQYYEQHKEEIQEQRRLRREANRDSARNYSRQRYYAHKEEILAQSKARYEAKRDPAPLCELCGQPMKRSSDQVRTGVCSTNPECNRERLRRRNLSEAAKAGVRRYRARKLAVPHEDWSKSSLVTLYGNRCYLCGIELPANESDWDADHVIPISKGGFDVLTNLRPSCSSCNRGKCAKVTDAHSAAIAFVESMLWAETYDGDCELTVSLS